MSNVFEFGEEVEGYSVRVLNERAVRAAAGILLFLGLISFMNAWLIGNFQPTRLFVLAFLAEFSIRLFVNPKYAPTMIIGQWMVRKQQADWAGAPQKRFAWAIGFVLALVMAYTMVFNSMIGPVNIITCAICLTLMLFETSFGICVGCKLYNLLTKNKAQLCPGGVCEMPADKNLGIKWEQLAVLSLSVFAIVGMAQWVYSTSASETERIAQATKPAATTSLSQSELERCTPPDFAKAMGHEEKWKRHNNCK
jgi:Domain of unknown function (DUF4395)